jgi:hypothetical protein
VGREGRGNGNSGDNSGDIRVREVKIRAWEYSDGEREREKK